MKRVGVTGGWGERGSRRASGNEITGGEGEGKGEVKGSSDYVSSSSLSINAFSASTHTAAVTR